MDKIILGRRLRTLRMRQGLSGAALAKLADVSPSLISRIERGKALPSLIVLQRLANSLRCSLNDLVNESPNATVADEARARVAKRPINHMVVRKNERLKMIHPLSEAIYELVTPDLSGRHEILQVILKPGQEHVSRSGAHPEGQETALVLQGQCQVWVGDDSTTLSEGDAITFDATIPHRYRNTGIEDVVLIAVVTPPHVGV